MRRALARRVLPQSVRRGNRRFTDHLLFCIGSDIMTGWEFNPDLELYSYNAYDRTATRAARDILSPSLIAWIGEVVRQGCGKVFGSVAEVMRYVGDSLALGDCDICIASELLRDRDTRHPGWYDLNPKTCRPLPPLEEGDGV